MFQKARDQSVPLDTIEKAIKRAPAARGRRLRGDHLRGLRPGGVALLVDVLTDNRNRSGSDVRSVFTKRGGSMAEPGAVAWQFDRKGTMRSTARSTRTT
jgi:transcriptional/translational regulatory protein YebC/TACO1